MLPSPLRAEEVLRVRLPMCENRHCAIATAVVRLAGSVSPGVCCCTLLRNRRCLRSAFWPPP